VVKRLPVSGKEQAGPKQDPDECLVLAFLGGILGSEKISIYTAIEQSFILTS
jgi:hypothetical protein